jgi:hypothetical protein
MIIKNKSQVRYQVDEKNNNAKKVKNSHTGEIYNTVKEAAQKAGYTTTYLIIMLKGKRKNTTGMSYLIEEKQQSSFVRAKW